jgi:transcription elongation factor GreB
VNKAFVREGDEQDDEEPESAPALPAGATNYLTTRGHAALRSELKQLVERERPDLVQVVAWAASNGDRSENGDYIYGKKRLREIDRRIRFLMKRLESAVVVDPSQRENATQVFFGATVTVCDVGGSEAGAEETFQIVGVDEANAGRGMISWISPLARALLKAREGDVVRFHSPAGPREMEVIAIRYLA